jgi:hypothetical protein
MEEDQTASFNSGRDGREMNDKFLWNSNVEMAGVLNGG